MSACRCFFRPPAGNACFTVKDRNCRSFARRAPDERNPSKSGALRRIRTSDRSVRSRVLYPAELRMQMAVRRGFEPRMQLLTAYSLSRGAPSASRPPHHTPLTSASKNLFIAHRRCVAHILLSETYKSNNFSHTFIVCTLHAQLVCKNVKKSVLSTKKRRSVR